MRKIFIIAIAALSLTGCAMPVLKTPYLKDAYVFDYSEYSKKGFFITESNTVSFNYEPVGSVFAISKSGYEVVNKTSKTKVFTDDTYGSSQSATTEIIKYGDTYIEATRKDILDEMYKKALQAGANGLINFKFSFDGEKFEATGMAIKK